MEKQYKKRQFFNVQVAPQHRPCTKDSLQILYRPPLRKESKVTSKINFPTHIVMNRKNKIGSLIHSISLIYSSIFSQIHADFAKFVLSKKRCLHWWIVTQTFNKKLNFVCTFPASLTPPFMRWPIRDNAVSSHTLNCIILLYFQENMVILSAVWAGALIGGAWTANEIQPKLPRGKR